MPIPLVERSQKEIERAVRIVVEDLPEVKACPQVSVRAAGKRFEVRVHVLLDSNLWFSEVHRIVSAVQGSVSALIPYAQVFVHTEPAPGDRRSLAQLVRQTVAGVPGSRSAHNVQIQRFDGKLGVDFHLEVGANLTLKQAYDTALEAEARIREAIPELSIVHVHVESASDNITNELMQVDPEIKWYVEHVAKRIPLVKGVNGIKVYRTGGQLHVIFNCLFAPSISMRQACEVARKIEDAIRKAYPNIKRIDIVEKPVVRGGSGIGER